MPNNSPFREGTCPHCGNMYASVDKHIERQHLSTPTTSSTDDELRENLLKILVNHTIDIHFNTGKKFEAIRNGESDEAAANALLALIRQDREAREAEHLKIYSWLLGLRGDFPVPITGRLYGWRSILRSKLPKDILFNINKLTSPPDSKAKA